MMPHTKCTKKIICIAAALSLLWGCGYVAPITSEGTASEEEEFTSFGLEPEFDYELPVSLPNILVDQVGYARNSNKIAIFQGESLPDAFAIVDYDTGQTVYTGEVEEKGYDSVTGVFVSYGDFSDFKRVGNYYIESSLIGRSYPFCIAEEPYEELFGEIQKQYYYNRCGLALTYEYAGDAVRSACHMKEAQMKEEASVKLNVSGGWHMDKSGSRDVSKGCISINSLLLAYELYPEVFGDDIGIPESKNGVPDILDEVKYEITWLLKMQDATSGAVYASVNNVDSQTSGYILYVDGVTMEATIRYAATLAKFSYLYQNYDREFATVCLKAADRAYRYAGKYLADVAEEEYFYAAAELYRATGNYTYHNVVKEYLDKNPSLDMKNDFVFWGCVTYLATKQRVEMDLCSDVIGVLMKEVEQISYASKNSKLLVNVDKEQLNSSEMLQDISRLAVVDHIITNHEYTTVLENHLHFFLGRNFLSVSYLDNVGTRSYMEVDASQGIMKQIDLNSELVLMMSAILDEEITDGIVEH